MILPINVMVCPLLTSVRAFPKEIYLFAGSPDDISQTKLPEEPVAGNTAVITPEFALFVTVAVGAPATVKEFAATPVRVYPSFGVRVMVAVYALPASKGLCAGDQVTVPVY